MKIEIYYLDNSYEQLDTNTLTSMTFGGLEAQSVMTKFKINFNEFLDTSNPGNLNIYIYYYKANNDMGSSITNSQYLDELMFYNNDKCIYSNPNTSTIKKLNKELPYGSMDPGCWFTIVPLSKKSMIKELTIDGRVFLQRNDKNLLETINQ